MRHITEAGLKLIESFEGKSYKIYRCEAGYDTIGYGHLIRPQERERFVSGIDQETAEDLLRQDVLTAERAVIRYISVRLSDNQFDALVSFTFNLGAGTLQRSSLRQKLNRGSYNEVPAEFMKWVRAGGRVSKGIQRRRAAEAALFKS